jgi:hypothetical protein
VGTPDLPHWTFPPLGRFTYSLVPRHHHLPLGEFGCATRNRSAELARAACEEHQALKRELLRSPDVKADFQRTAATTTASFQSCWRPLLPGYPNLREVAAGLATIFPGSSSVESDFSILKLDKSPQRSNLADLTIEGQFYSRQWRGLERLEAICK